MSMIVTQELSCNNKQTAAVAMMLTMESDLVQNSSAKNLSVSTNLDQHQPLFYNTFNKLNQHQ